jgi:CRISPR-associated protein (TIGR02584 family)
MTASEPSDPGAFPRRVLLASVGLTPQVVTETVHALAERAEAPTALVLLTTAAGARACRGVLLGEGGALAAYAADWGRPWARELADAAAVEVAETDSGDLDAARAAAQFADRAGALVRALTGDTGGALHVSLAGGRKPAAAALAVALTLWGRPQDRLSHVLVDEPFSAHPGFFYPAPAPRPLLARDGGLIDAAAARVRLIEIGFPRLRRFAAGDADALAAAVAAAQARLDSVRLGVDRDRGLVLWDGAALPWPAAVAAFAAWLAADLLAGGAGVPRVGAARRAWLAAYAAFGGRRAAEAAARRLPEPLDPEWMEEKASRLAKLAAACGAAPRGASLVARTGPRAASRYRLALDPHEVGWIGPPLELAA